MGEVVAGGDAAVLAEEDAGQFADDFAQLDLPVLLALRALESGVVLEYLVGLPQVVHSLVNAQPRADIDPPESKVQVRLVQETSVHGDNQC